jgi:integral membrane protein (TIGR01906 family)
MVMVMKWGLAGLAVIFLVIILFLTSIEIVAFDLKFYENEYEKLNVVQNTGMSNEELMRVTQELLKYLRDEREDLEITGVIDGESRQVFNEREIAHMVDVKDLFLRGMKLRVASIVFFLLSLLLLYWLVRKRIYRYLARSFLWIFGVILFLGIVLSILMYQDFTPVWSQFHYIFFSNNLWQLNPETDILIRMVPEQFFFDTVQRILFLFGGAMIILSIPSIIAVIKRR